MFSDAVDASGQKRRKEEMPVFEQAENVDNPLRCPVKLYEFYLSKWLVLGVQFLHHTVQDGSCGFNIFHFNIFHFQQMLLLCYI